jgi:hypothetical protein
MLFEQVVNEGVLMEFRLEFLLWSGVRDHAVRLVRSVIVALSSPATSEGPKLLVTYLKKRFFQYLVLLQYEDKSWAGIAQSVS